MGKYKITQIPGGNTNKPSASKTLSPVDRQKANVEAEKGETAVFRKGMHNLMSAAHIGGKKHSEGGTPLLLDEGSFIFSDNKSNRMIVKDPAVLTFFGQNPKKPKTIADLSKPWINSINKSNQVIVSEDADKLAKDSAKLTMDNASFMIAALKLYQESKKGFKDGMPEGVTPFFDKLQTDPSELFAMNQEDADKTNNAVAMAFGGLVKDYREPEMAFDFPSLAMGGELRKYVDGGKVYKESELPQNAIINTTGKNFKVGQFVLQPDGTYKKVTKLNVNPSTGTKTSSGPISAWIAQSPENKVVAEQANAIIEKGINDKTIEVLDGKKGTIKITGTFNPTFKEKVILSRVINQSGKDFSTDRYKIVDQGATGPYSTVDSKTKSIKGTGSFVAGFTPEDYEKRYVFEKAKASGLSDDEAFAEVDNIYKDQAKTKEVRKEYINFLGITPPQKDDELLAPDFYKKNYAAVTKGLETKLEQAGYRPAWGDDHLSGLEHFDAISFTANPEYEADYNSEGPCPTCPDGTTLPRNIDGSCPPCAEIKPEYKKLGQTAPLENPYAFRREDINSLNRALAARFEIPKIHPWAKSSQTVFPDRAYVSPERAIAASNEQVNQVMKGVSAFGNAQAAGSTASSIYGKAYGDVADQISNYADKNAGIFTAGEQYHAQLANARNERDAQLATNIYDKESYLKNNFANSLSAAKDKITQLANQAFTNASNIYNLNLTSENFKKDPFTGLIYKANDKPFTATQTAPKDFGTEFTEFVKYLPTVTPDLQMKAFLAYKSGKYQIEPDDQLLKANDLQNLNLPG